MHGVIIIQGDKTKFRHNETNKHYLVVGTYDVEYVYTTSFNFKHLQEAEALKGFTDGTVIIKFSPI